MVSLALITISLVINTNYFSLWMMEPLGTSTDSSYEQYNITIQMVSGCFLLSSVGYYIAYRLFTDFRNAFCISKAALLIYGTALTFVYWNYDVNYVSALVLGFGFHQITTMELGYLLQNKWNFDLMFYLKNEVIAYFILPLIFMVCNIGQESLQVYALTSGLCLVIGVLLL